MSKNFFEKTGKQNRVFSGKIFEVIHQEMKLGSTIKTFEIARRSPGVRVIVVKDNTMLLSKEYRHEIQAYDYRLPGGKVFDILEEYRENTQDIPSLAEATARKELLEETGLDAEEIKFFTKITSGATIEWDIYCFIVESFTQQDAKKELGEDIEIDWYSFDEVLQLCKQEYIHEPAILACLFRFFLSKGKIL